MQVALFHKSNADHLLTDSVLTRQTSGEHLICVDVVKGGQGGQTVAARPLGASQKCQGQTMNWQQADGGCAVTSLHVEGSPGVV